MPGPHPMKRWIAAIAFICLLMSAGPVGADGGPHEAVAGSDAGSGEVYAGVRRRHGVGLSSATTGGVPCVYGHAMGDGPAPEAVEFDMFDDDGVRYELWLAQCGDHTIYYWQAMLTRDQLMVDMEDEARRALPALRLNWVPMAALSKWTWVKWPNYVWVDSTAPVSATAATIGLSITATAVPTRLSVSPGDGSSHECRGDARPPTEAEVVAVAGDSAAGVCSFKYTTTSANQPNSTFVARFALAWDIYWTASDGTTGQLAGLNTVTSIPMKVAKIEAINTAP